MKAYKVIAKCGHVGQNFYIDKVFAVMAETGKDAAEKVRYMPRVKHHHKDAIRSVEEISIKEFWKLKRIIDEDAYFSCHNIQDQRKIVLDGVTREQKIERKGKEENRTTKYSGKQAVRNQKKYFTHYIDLEEMEAIWA